MLGDRQLGCDYFITLRSNRQSSFATRPQDWTGPDDSPAQGHLKALYIINYLKISGHERSSRTHARTRRWLAHDRLGGSEVGPRPPSLVQLQKYACTKHTHALTQTVTSAHQASRRTIDCDCAPLANQPFVANWWRLWPLWKRTIGWIA